MYMLSGASSVAFICDNSQRLLTHRIVSTVYWETLTRFLIWRIGELAQLENKITTSMPIYNEVGVEI